MRTGGECAGDCESTVHSSAIRCAATRNKGPQWRWQPQPATGVPSTLKWGYTQRHARPMQDKVVIKRMKGTLARRTGSGAAGVWVGATNRYVQTNTKGRGEGGGCCAAGTSLHREPQSCHIVCGQARERDNGAGAVGGGGAFRLPALMFASEKTSKGPPRCAAVRAAPRLVPSAATTGLCLGPPMLDGRIPVALERRCLLAGACSCWLQGQ